MKGKGRRSKVQDEEDGEVRSRMDCLEEGGEVRFRMECREPDGEVSFWIKCREWLEK